MFCVSSLAWGFILSKLDLSKCPRSKLSHARLLDLRFGAIFFKFEIVGMV